MIVKHGLEITHNMPAEIANGPLIDRVAWAICRGIYVDPNATYFTSGGKNGRTEHIRWHDYRRAAKLAIAAVGKV